MSCPLVVENNRYTVDFDRFEQLAAREDVKLFMLCNPHNPGGRVWTAGELRRMGEICARCHVLVVSDEIHCDLTLGENRYTPYGLAAPELLAESVICVAPSKSFNLAGMQTSCLLIPDEALRKKYQQHMVMCGIKRPNVLGMTAMIAAYTECAEWLAACRAYLTQNFQFMRD